MIEALVFAAATVVPPAEDSTPKQSGVAYGKPWVPLSKPKEKKLKFIAPIYGSSKY